MADRYIKWDKLDNTANLFPVIAGEKMTNTYRISVVLTEEIQPELLQEALDMVTPKDVYKRQGECSATGHIPVRRS